MYRWCFEKNDFWTLVFGVTGVNGSQVVLLVVFMRFRKFWEWYIRIFV